MVQLQILNRVLDTKDMKLLVENNLTEEYFIEYPDEYAFIKNHFDTYGKVPDIETFMSNFQDFDRIVTRSAHYFKMRVILNAHNMTVSA